MRRKEKIHCYKGAVVDIQNNIVICHFTNQQDALDVVYVEFYEHVLKPKNRVVGQFLRWTYGWHRKGGKLRPFNEVKPIDIKYTNKDIYNIKRLANRIAKQIKWCLNE